jgi:uncharacterized membrane protein YbhN (UPF0104 family)
MWKHYFSLLLAAILIVASIVLFDVEHALVILSGLNAKYMVVSMLLALLIYSVSGIQYNAVLASQGIRLSASDTVTFPIIMNLWSLLIPFQGALLFSTLFFARKYGRAMSGSLSVSLFLYMVTVSLSGLLGLIFVLSTGRAHGLVLLLLCGIMVSPVFVPLAEAMLRRLLPSQGAHPLLSRVTSFLTASLVALRMLMSDRKLLLQIIALKLVQTSLVGVWYWVIASGLGLDVSLVVLMLLSLVGELAIIIKVTPDNLGVNQLLSGALLAAMGFNPQWGVLISLMASATTLVLILTVGLYGNQVFMRDHGIDSLHRMMRSFLKSKD